MPIRPEATNTNPGPFWRKVALKPVQDVPLWLLVGISCMAMAGLLCTISTRTVQADAPLQKPIALPPQVVVSTPQVNVAQPTETKPRHRFFRGIASWYGSAFDGRQTASGETFSMDEMTACHPTLPFGSEVRVVNLRNHKSVVVRITDRAELVKGRAIDLSYAAAEKLNMTKTGIARVSIEVLSLGHPGA